MHSECSFHFISNFNTIIKYTDDTTLQLYLSIQMLNCKMNFVISFSGLAPIS